MTIGKNSEGDAMQLTKDNSISEWPGFTVYDAESGENLSDKQLYLLDPEGQLVKVVYNGSSVVLVRPMKKGRYIIQFGSGKYMVW